LSTYFVSQTSMNSIIRSTGIVALATLASRILGFLRDMLMASFFGASGTTDAFFVAFKIPNLFRRFVAEGALTISFIPVYTEYLVNKGRDEALELAQKTLTLQIVALIFLIGLGEYFSPEIVKLFAIGFKDPSLLSLATDLNMIMFPYLFFVSLVAFAMGVLNSHKYFFAPSFAPVLLNVGIITGIIFLSRFFDQPLHGVAIGVLLGGLLQVILQIPYMIRAGFKMKISFDFNHPGMRRIFRMLGPALYGMAIYQINSLIITILASFKEKGSISYLYYSDRLTELVLGVFIVSIGNVILPEMSKLTATDDLDKLKKLYIQSMSGALFLAVPATVALMGLGYPVISVIYLHGKFTPFDAEMTQLALFYASLGITAVSMLRLTTPTFYSLKDTVTPVIGATMALVSNTVLGYFLMDTGLKHAGLMLALSISTTLQVVFLMIMLRRKIGRLGLKKLFIATMKFLAASLVMLLVCHFIARLIDWDSARLWLRALVLMAIVTAGGLVYALSCFILKVEEMQYVYRRLKR